MENVTRQYDLKRQLAKRDERIEELEEEIDNAHAAICAAIDSGEIQNEFVLAKLRKGLDNQPQDAH